MKKYLLVFLMFINFILLLIPALGTLFNLILSITFMLLVVIHVIFNFDSILSVFDKKSKLLKKLSLLLDAIIAALLILKTTSSVLMYFNLVSDQICLLRWYEFYNYILLIIVSIHIGLHLKTNYQNLKKELSIKHVAKYFVYIYRFIVIIMMALGVYSFFTKEQINKIKGPFKSLNSEFNYNKINTKKDEYYNSNSDTTLDNESGLDNYLGGLFCTGCHKHCPLTHPLCMIGAKERQESVKEYNKYSNTDENIDNGVTKLNNVVKTATTTNDGTKDKFLSKLYCDGCGRHCSLLAPSCAIGYNKRETALVDYQNDKVDYSLIDKSSIVLFIEELGIIVLFIHGTYIIKEKKLF